MELCYLGVFGIATIAYVLWVIFGTTFYDEFEELEQRMQPRQKEWWDTDDDDSW